MILRSTGNENVGEKIRYTGNKKVALKGSPEVFEFLLYNNYAHVLTNFTILSQYSIQPTQKLHVYFKIYVPYFLQNCTVFI